MKIHVSFTIVILLLVLTATAQAQETRAKLEGQVVCCAECWAEADRAKVPFGTAEDLLKAKSCVEGGDPTLLAVREGDKFKLYRLATGKYRLPGKNWLEFIGKSIAVEGTIQSRKETSIIRVDTLAVVAPSLAEQEAAKLTGKQVDLSLKDLSGAEQSLAGYKGRIVILNFWATYCIPCRTEMPDLAAIQNEFGPFGVQVIGVNTDDEDDRKKVLQFVKETKINFPVWVGGSIEQMMRFGLGGALPGTVVIGQDGRIAKIISGVVDPVALKKDIESLIKIASASPGKKEPSRRATASAVPS
ncbi:MAG TPA: TlpA disulfide reductase family protein [Pyrinomonadaceae bacterium]|nr:TlpA disulfide reductase family protein [Pyrinomonadaceae bacterium]